MRSAPMALSISSLDEETDVSGGNFGGPKAGWVPLEEKSWRLGLLEDGTGVSSNGRAAWLWGEDI